MSTLTSKQSITPLQVPWAGPSRAWERLAIAVDCTLIIAAAPIAGVLYHLIALGTFGDVIQFAAVGTLVSALVVPILSLRGSPGTGELFSPHKQMWDVVTSWIAALLLLLVLAFALKISDTFSRGFVITFVIIGLAALLGRRVIWQRVIQKSIAFGGLQGPKVLLISEHTQSSRFEQELSAEGYEIRARLHLPQEDAAVSVDRFLERALRSIEGRDLDEVVICCDWREWSSIAPPASVFQATHLPVRLVLDHTTAQIFKRPWRRFGSTVAIEIQRAPLSLSERILKRSFDLVGAFCSLLLLTPLLAVVAVAIKLNSKGPILFRQTRNGFNGKQFTIRNVAP